MTDEQESKGQKAERKRIDAIWWAGVLIWIGLVLGAENLNILPRIGDGAEWWLWIFIGAGLWALLLNVYSMMSDWPRPTTWDWVWTVIFLLVGLGGVLDIGGEIVGAVVLVGIGAVFLARALSGSE